jgi:hypothetical protein
MEPEGSLPPSQELSTFPYPDPEQSSAERPILYFHIFLWSYIVQLN